MRVRFLFFGSILIAGSLLAAGSPAIRRLDRSAISTGDIGHKEKKLPLTQNSVLTAASFTKAAFAYLVMQLVDERLVDFDKPIQDYLPKPLPDYRAYADLAGDPRYRPRQMNEK